MRTAKRTRRISAPLFLLPALFFVQALFYLTANLLRVSWQEEKAPPLAVTREWLPNQTYSPQIEQGIAALVGSDPEKVTFLRARGIPIHVLTQAQMIASGCSSESIGCTRLKDSSINVVASAAESPVALAVVLSHEVTHCRLHDQAVGNAIPSVWSRLLWRNEEAKAHVAGLRTASHLGLPLLGGRLTGWWLDYLIWYWPAATMLMTGLASLLGCRLIAEYIRKNAALRIAQSSNNFSAILTFQQPDPTPVVLQP